MVVAADVTKVEEVEAAVKAVEEKFTHIHYCFNNAGYQGDFTMVQNYSAEDF